MVSPSLIRLLVILLQQEGKVQRAEGVATFSGSVNGQVFFTPTDRSQINITGVLFGFQRKRTMGVHIHETGDLENHCNNAGGHWNPINRTHGGLDSEIRHDGDLGNLQTDRRGRMTFNLRVNQNRFDPTDGFIGLSLVIHEQQDDLGLGGNAASLANGNSGRRVACAVIGYKKKPTFGICTLP
ncbi:copper/zinc superoxide dismutase [Opisthorchis viverrini]|uniref:Superoxide dismutase [Cu-Zn] n=2 Tax=Opisthorchis viverrini TaxID=6198 RepID=A0A1S8X4A4_OPIVI|nr:copper/zinc superoxide dismutase [Opisthorchis viverrini]